MSKDKGPDNKLIRELIEESASRSALEVDGVAEVNDVKSDMDQDLKTAELKIYLDVYFGFGIPSVSWDVQNAVKAGVKTASGYDAEKIDIYIQGVVPKKETDE
ncbi:MAG: Asp23/Gls24 family envelope stress response protein [Firmicutes bacterium]|nr:Asp23/Gls24 family envelope stress response protein [Bacillota bacterium]